MDPTPLLSLYADIRERRRNLTADVRGLITTMVHQSSGPFDLLANPQIRLLLDIPGDEEQRSFTGKAVESTGAGVLVRLEGNADAIALADMQIDALFALADAMTTILRFRHARSKES